MKLQCKGRLLDLSRPKVMGILNATPDSFSDGGRHHHLSQAIDRVAEMLTQGADMVDVGGESTRPGAAAVEVEEELSRVVPLIEVINARFDVPISIDTSKAVVMRESVKAGACLINDVRALQEPEAVAEAAASGAGVCLMHMQGQPRTMQAAPHYAHVVNDVANFLQTRLEVCLSNGIERTQILLDPGFGFGKTLEHNLQLLRELESLHSLGCPLLIGVSRKSMIGGVLQTDVNNRMIGSVAAAVMSMERGAGILRVHDVLETAQAVKMFNAIRYGDI